MSEETSNTSEPGHGDAHGDRELPFNPIVIFFILVGLTAISWGADKLQGSLSVLTISVLVMFVSVSKASLVIAFFMHFKYEGWIVKALVAPTPFLVAVVVFAIMPDVAKNSRMDHRITDQADPVTGEIVTLGSRDHSKDEEGGGGH